MEVPCPRRPEREEAAHRLRPRLPVAVHECRVRAEPVERSREAAHLVSAHRAQKLRRQPPFAEEVEDFGRPVVARRIVRAAREPLGSGSVAHPPFVFRPVQRRELREPPRDGRAQPTVRRHPQEAVPLAELAVLVPAPHDEGAFESHAREVEGDRVQRVIGVHEEVGPHPLAALRHAVESADDAGVAVEDGGDEHARRLVVRRETEPLGERVDRVHRHPNDGESLLLQPVELAPDGVELPRGRHEPRPRAQRQGGEEADDEFVGVRAQRVVPVVRALGASEEFGVPGADPIPAGERLLPLPVHEPGGVLPGPELSREAAVGPRLVRMSREEQPLRDPEAGIVRSERVRLPVQVLRREARHSSVRIAHRSGNTGRFSDCLR